MSPIGCIYSENRRGPIPLPWGTPIYNTNPGEYSSFRHTRWHLSVRYDSIHLRAVPETCGVIDAEVYGGQ